MYRMVNQIPSRIHSVNRYRAAHRVVRSAPRPPLSLMTLSYIPSRVTEDTTRAPTMYITAIYTESADKECAICLCEFSIGDDCALTVCNHRFHINCIDEAINKHKLDKCPLCRTNLKD